MNKGLSIEGICDVPMIQDWKLELMAKMIFDGIWSDKEKVLSIANQLLESSMSEKPKKDYDSEIKRYETLLEKQRLKLDNLIDMRLSEEISKETYQKKRSEIESNIEELQTKIENCMNADEDSAVSLERKVAALKSVMEQDFDFDTGNIPDSIIDAFVDHIKVYKDKFVWKLNFLDTDVTCLASGTRKKHEVSIVDFPSSVYGSTGSNS